MSFTLKGGSKSQLTGFHWTNFRRATRRFWLITEVPRIGKIFHWFYQKYNQCVFLKVFFLAIAEAATSCPEEVVLQLPLEMVRARDVIHP